MVGAVVHAAVAAVSEAQANEVHVSHQEAIESIVVDVRISEGYDSRPSRELSGGDGCN